MTERNDNSHLYVRRVRHPEHLKVYVCATRPVAISLEVFERIAIGATPQHRY